jgi:hypothetical protein
VTARINRRLVSARPRVKRPQPVPAKPEAPANPEALTQWLAQHREDQHQ